VVTTVKGTTSYVTVRGSIPLYWQEGEALVTLKPKPHVLPGRPHLDAMVAHLRMLAALYGQVLMLSLIDAHGNEANIHRVLSSFAVHVLRSKNGEPSASGLGAFVPFDFHAECGKSASALGMFACARCGQCPQDHIVLRCRRPVWSANVLTCLGAWQPESALLSSSTTRARGLTLPISFWPKRGAAERQQPTRQVGAQTPGTMSGRVKNAVVTAQGLVKVTSTGGARRARLEQAR
jgi:hypothetical protein